MRKYIVLSLALLLATSVFAKKVKFAVDMTGIAINATGMHITGDFQAAAGFTGGDWQSNTTSLYQESVDTNIYSIVVDIPAFAKYEYKFLNGDQFYDVEFVPEPSRVGYNFNDNRWLYVDSLTDDTTFVGAIQFSGNAPAGLKLIRFKVDMENATPISAVWPHVAGTHQGWDPKSTILYSFGDSVYEIINYVDSNTTYQYKYYNGNTASDAETVPAGCATNGNRAILVNSDTVLNVVCFSACDTCSKVSGIHSTVLQNGMQVYPNPAGSSATLQLTGIGNYEVSLTDYTGQLVRYYADLHNATLQINRESLSSGVYLLRVTNKLTGESALTKLQFN